MVEWTEEQLEQRAEEDERTVVFIYTPLCGTCQLAKKMLTVTQAMIPNFEIGMCNLNFMPGKAKELCIESVPCLVMLEGKQPVKKIYAFHSIEYLLDEVKSFSA